MLIYLTCVVLLCLAMGIAWSIRMRTGQSGWIDAVWSSATGVAGVIAALSAADGERRWLAAFVIALWAGRLASHIVLRTRGKGDDPRYAALAREWGADFPRRLFIFLQIQAASSLPLIAAIAAAARAPRPFPDLFDLAGVLVMLVAVVGEGLADAQLSRFRRTGVKGGICEIGLWRFSRHPNYFFEFLFWCGWPLLAFGVPQGLIALAAPAFIYYLLVHVSGVPLLEKQMRATRGEAFEAYARRVNCFFPGPPRKG